MLAFRPCASTRLAGRGRDPYPFGRSGFRDRLPRAVAYRRGMRSMSRIDESRPFLPLSIAVLTVSDTRSLEEDKSGATLEKLLTGAGHKLGARAIVKDDKKAIAAKLRGFIEDPKIDVVITTGGTGFTGRDVTPEAVEPLFDKRMEGFSTVFHHISFGKIGTSTIQS